MYKYPVDKKGDHSLPEHNYSLFDELSVHLLDIEIIFEAPQAYTHYSRHRYTPLLGFQTARADYFFLFRFHHYPPVSVDTGRSLSNLNFIYFTIYYMSGGYPPQRTKKTPERRIKCISLYRVLLYPGIYNRY